MTDAESVLPNIRAWCEPFPKVFACIAVTLAMSGRSTGTMVRGIFSTKSEGDFPLPRDPDAWLEMYRSEKALFDRMRIFGPMDPSITLMFELVDLCGQLSEVEDPNDPTTERIAAEGLERLYVVVARMVNDKANPSSGDASEKTAGSDEELAPELVPAVLALLFFVTVLIPCRVMHQSSPAWMITRARRGDRHAVEALLQMDEMVLADPRISKFALSQPGARELLRSGVTSTPKVATNEQWKARMAAMIHLLSDAFQIKVSYAQIIDLYHAIAMDCDGSPRGDEVLRFADSRTFERKVNREKKFWNYTKPSQKSGETHS